jgi:hypothetical protein
MRGFSLALGLVCTLLMAGAQAQAPKPGPEQKRLDVFVGNWTFEGEAKPGPGGPGGKVTGTDRNQMLGGFFMERRFEEKGPMGELRGVLILGYDPTKKTYIASGFDSAGGFSSGTIAVSGNTWTFSASGVSGGKPMQTRCPLTFAAGNNSFTVTCEVSTDGKNWTPSFEGRWTKSR